MPQYQDETDTEERDNLPELSQSQRDLAWSRRRKRTEPQVEIETSCGSKAKSAGNDSRPKTVNLKSVPVGLRLSVNHKSSLDRIKDKIGKPDGRVPRTFLPLWPVMSMDSKIPYINCPYTLMYYSRGNLGENLWRKGQDYYLYDPELRNRVIGEAYNALHDPHTRNYLRTPVVKKVLLEQGLINSRGEVLCNVAQFNKFRNYLRNLYVVQISSALGTRDQSFQNELMQMKQIRKELNTAEGKGAVATCRLATAKEYQTNLQKERMNNFALKLAEDAERSENIRRAREERHMLRVLRSLDRSQVRNDRMHEFYMREQQKKEMLIVSIALKEKEAEERRAQEEQLARLASRQYKIEYLDSKFDYGEERLKKQEELSQAFQEDLQKKTIRRQKRMEHERAVLPDIVRKRKKEAQRLDDIVRKYAMRWLDKVRQRKKRKPDAMHLSLWETNVILDETNKYLRAESGYEKLDDFILSIIKLKEEIRAQLEAEEKAEAEAAAAEEQANEEEEEAMTESISPEGLVEDILEDIIDNATSLYASNMVENVVTDFMGKVQSKCSKVLHLHKGKPGSALEKVTASAETEGGNISTEKFEEKRDETISSGNLEEKIHESTSKEKLEENIENLSNIEQGAKAKTKRRVRGKGTVTMSQVTPQITQTKSEDISATRNVKYSKAKSILSDSGFVSDWSAPIEVPIENQIDDYEKKGDYSNENEVVMEIFTNPKKNLSDVSVPATASLENQEDQVDTTSDDKEDKMESPEEKENKVESPDVKENKVESHVGEQEALNEVGVSAGEETEESLFGNTVSGFRLISEVENSVSKFIANSESVLGDILSRNCFFSSQSSYTDFSSDVYKNLDPPVSLKQAAKEISQESSNEEQESDAIENVAESSEQEQENNEIQSEKGQENVNDTNTKNDAGPPTSEERPKSRARKHFFDTILRACCSEVISLERFVVITSRKREERKKTPEQNLLRCKTPKKPITPRSQRDNAYFLNKILLKEGVSSEKIADYHETRGIISHLLGKPRIIERIQCIKSSSNTSLTRGPLKEQPERKGFTLQRAPTTPTSLPYLQKHQDISTPQRPNSGISYSGRSAKSARSSTSGFSSDADVESHYESDFRPMSPQKRKSKDSLDRSPAQARVLGGAYLSSPFALNQFPLKCTAKIDKSDTSVECDNSKRYSVKYVQFEVPTCANRSNSKTSCENRSSSCTRLPPLHLHQLPKSRREFNELVSPTTSSRSEKRNGSQPVKVRGTSSGTRLPHIGPFCEGHLKNTEEVYKPKIRNQSSFTKLPSLHLNAVRRQESNSSFLSTNDYPLRDKFSFSKSKEDQSRSKKNGSVRNALYEIIHPSVPSSPCYRPNSSLADTDSLSGYCEPIRSAKSKRKKSSYLLSISNYSKLLADKDDEVIDKDNQWISNRPLNDISAAEVLGRALLIVEHSIKRMVLPDILKYMFDDHLAMNINVVILNDTKSETENTMLTNITKIAFAMAKDCANYERVKGTKCLTGNDSFLETYETKYSKQIQDICISVAVSILKKISANAFPL